MRPYPRSHTVRLLCAALVLTACACRGADGAEDSPTGTSDVTAGEAATGGDQPADADTAKDSSATDPKQPPLPGGAGGKAAGSGTADSRPPVEGVSGGRATMRETLVVVEPLEVGPIRDEVLVSARVEADVSVAVFPKLTGLPITHIAFDEGETVQAGDVLMTLYDTELRLAEQRAKSAYDQKTLEVKRQQLKKEEEEARIVRTERAQQKQLEDLARLEGLVADGLVNKQEVADARLEAEQATDDLDLSRFERDAAVIESELARIAEVQAQIDWKRAQEDLLQTQVRSPITGVVAERSVEIGELSSQGEMAFHLVDVTRPTLELRVPQDAMARLREGQSVEARSVTGASQLFHGTVRRVNPVLDRATGSVSVLVDLEPAPGLVPGLFCEARIVTAARDEALLIDKRAVRYDDDQPVFFALDETGTAVRRIAFVAGTSTSMKIEILSDADGASVPSDLSVVIVGHENLKDGSRVRVQEEPY